MPRFENEGFNPEKRNRNENVDRTVPQDENYYSFSPVDLDFNSREKNTKNNRNYNTDINQYLQNTKKTNQGGINPCNSSDRTVYDRDNRFVNDIEPPQHFRSETSDDFISRNSSNRNRNNNPKNEKKKRKKLFKPKFSLGKLILVIILILIFSLFGGFSSVMGKITYSDKEENSYVSRDELMSSSSVKNILLLGVDARADEEAESTRSDTMMLVSFDTKHKCMKMVSFLRDTWCYIPSLGYEQRLNAACSSGGYQGVIDAIEYNFGVAIDGYAVVDFQMFKVLVDSIGGVEIDVTQAEAEEVTNHPNRYGNVTLESGKQILTGEQALAYCRIRKIDTDFVRTERQRTVLSAILNEAKSGNPFKLFKMASNSAPYIETNLSKSELAKITAMAGLCVTGDMVQTKVPFDGTWDYATIQGNSVISINVDENKQMLIDYLYNMSADDIKAQEEESE